MYTKTHTYKKFIALLLVLMMIFSMTPVISNASPGPAATGRLQINNLYNPMGIDTPSPVLSWIMVSNTRAQVQTGYQILVATSEDNLNEIDADMWNTGKVESDQSNNISYKGAPLTSKTRYYWAVRVWDKDGNPSTYSQPATFETALMNQNDWQAKWIQPQEGEMELYPVTIMLDAPVTAQYVKLKVSKVGLAVQEVPNFRLQIAELEIYGSASGSNLALNKPVTASVTHANSGAWSPDKINDGQRNSVGSSLGYCSPAYNYTSNPQHNVNPPIEITINLGSEQTVDRVVLYSRTDSAAMDNPALAGSFPKDFTIETRGASGNFAVAKTVTGQAEPKMPTPRPLPILGHSFRITQPIKSARAYVSGAGLYEMTINGQPVTGNVLEPGQSAYFDTMLYQTYDVTQQLQEGENAIGARLGKGLYSYTPTPGRYQKINTYYHPLQFIAQIEVTYEDGTTEIVEKTDDSWKTATGPLILSDWYGGETYDANLEIPGWNEPGFAYDGWDDVLLATAPLGKLTAHYYPPLQVMSEWNAVAVTNPAPDVYVVDFGRNYAGFFEFSLSASQGTTAQFWPSEVLRSNGRANQDSTGSPIYDAYTFKGSGVETWTQTFMYHGHRYVEIRGLGYEPTPDMFKAKEIRSANEKVGQFETSSDVLNQISTIINRSIESNMYDTLTDCPHREKLGWLEVPHLLYNSISPNFDVAAWMPKITNDILDTQQANGVVPSTAPEFWTDLSGDFRDSPTWSAALVMIPWYSYLTYGNTRQIEKAYPQMNLWMNDLASKSKGYLLDHGLGEWGSYDSSTTRGFTVSCTYYSVADTMRQIAQLLGKTQDEQKYETLKNNIYAAINAKYYHTDTKKFDSGSQAANAMALYYGLVPESEKEAVTQNLVKSVEAAGNHLTTGEIALRPLFMSLAQNDLNDVVYAMATNRTMPSYWYFIENDRTALPEYWDMGQSQNHCMMGHIEGWFYEYLGGIQNDSVAYKHFNVAPYIPNDLTYTDISTMSAYGKITSAWSMGPNNTITLKVEVPANSTATVYLPTKKIDRVTEGGTPISQPIEGITARSVENEKTKVDVGSGTYTFTIPAPIDKSGLRESISFAEMNVKSNVIFGWNALQEALLSGKAVYDDPEAEQPAVDAAKAALDRASSALILENVALKKVPMASSSLERLHGSGELWALANLLDGDRTHGAFNGDITKGGGGYSSINDRANQHTEWAGVDFGYAYTFNTLKLYPRNLTAYNNAPVDTFPEDFEIQISSNGKNWNTVKEIKSFPLLTTYDPVTVTLDEEVSARYVRVYATKLRPFGLDGGYYYLQFAEMEVYNTVGECTITAPDEVKQDELFTVTAVTPDNITALRLNNENELVISHRVEEKINNGDGTTTWVISTRIGTVGEERKISVYGKTSGSFAYLGSSSLNVLTPKPTEPGVVSFTVPASAVMKNDFTGIVVTDISVKKLSIYNETGLKMGVKTSYTDEGDVRTWSVALNVGTAGKRTFSVIGLKGDGTASTAINSNEVTVTAPAPTLPGFESFTLPETAVVNTDFTCTVVSDITIQTLTVYNETGSKMGIKNLAFTDKAGKRTFTFTMQVGTSGTRTFSVTGMNESGKASEPTSSNQIKITKNGQS